MIKIRPANSIEDAVTQACGLLGTETIAMALGARFGRSYSASLVQKWSDADNDTHRIGLHHALAIDELLAKSGHAPVFADLFERLKPAIDVAPVDPVHAAINTSVDAAKLLEAVTVAHQDGALEPHELVTIRASLTRLQQALAKFNRSLVVRPKTQAQLARK